jgi:hypothetical protein
VSDGGLLIVGTTLDKLENLINSEGNVVVDDSVAGRTPVGECKLPAGAKGFGSGIDN